MEQQLHIPFGEPCPRREDIDGQNAGAIRWDRKRGGLPEAQLEATLSVSLPAEAERPNRRDAKEYVRAAATLIPKPEEA